MYGKPVSLVFYKFSIVFHKLILTEKLPILMKILFASDDLKLLFYTVRLKIHRNKMPPETLKKGTPFDEFDYFALFTLNKIDFRSKTAKYSLHKIDTTQK